MWTTIALVILIGSFVSMFWIAQKKFPVLAMLDVENIQSEKEARFKETIISNRIRRNLLGWSSRIFRLFIVLWKKANDFSKFVYDNLVEMRNEHKKESVISEFDKSKKIKELFEDSLILIKNSSFIDAEKKLFEIIGMDSRNVEAFEQLGDLYLQMKNYQDAIETYRHTLRLIDIEDLSKIAILNHGIAFAAKMIDDYESALENIERALEIEPNNPRYLDFLLNLSIIIKDRSRAEDVYEKLLKANPENNKLADIKEKISAL